MAEDRLAQVRAWLAEHCPKVDTANLGESQIVELVHASLFLAELAYTGRKLEIVQLGGPGDAVDVYAQGTDGMVLNLQMTQIEEAQGDIRASRNRLGPQDAIRWPEVNLAGSKGHQGPVRSDADFNRGLQEALIRKANHQCLSPSVLVLVQTSPIPWDWEVFPPDLGLVALPSGFNEIWLVGASSSPGRQSILRLT